MVKTVHSLLATYYEPYREPRSQVCGPEQKSPRLLRPRLRMRGRIYRMSLLRRFDWWRLRCTCLRCCLRIPAWRTSIYQSQRNHHHDTLENALTRLQFLETFYLFVTLPWSSVYSLQRTARAQVNPSFHTRYTVQGYGDCHDKSS